MLASVVRTFPYQNICHSCISSCLSLIPKVINFTKPLRPFVVCHQPSERLFYPFLASAFIYPTTDMAENKFIIVYAKMGTSSCKKCKNKIEKAALRIGKVVANPFSDDGGDMKLWYHPNCIFETFLRARATTKIIEEAEDLEGFADLKKEDKDLVNNIIKDFFDNPQNKRKKSVSQDASKSSKKEERKSATEVKDVAKSSSDSAHGSKLASNDDDDDDDDSKDPKERKKSSASKDDMFRCFRQLCAKIADENSYLGKTQLVADLLTKGTSGDGFSGDTYLWLKLLLPGVVKVVYNLNSKQLVKLFSQIFNTSLEEMVNDLEQGDVAETVRIFFETNKKLLPQKKSTITLQEIDSLLTDLSKLTKEDDQLRCLSKIAKKCTGNDLKMVIRLIKHDLRINSGAKHILDGLDPNAYAAFQASRNLRDVVDRVIANRDSGEKPGMGSKSLSVRASLMTPVLPMLAEPCRSVEMAMRKCPSGFYAEIKYDGERVQVHKNGNEFRYFSRSLKPVQPHKVSHFKDYIPKAFPGGNDLILDAEVLLIDNASSKPLPFGSLGVHKKAAFKDANVCLFIFDCLHINGKNLMELSIQKRRKVLHENMTEIKNHVMFSEMQHITKKEDLQVLMTKVFREGLEGLVLKDISSIYEPGKRHWLKVKKDYLEQGSMADTADLVVLGAYHGTGNKGGLMSVFLTGVYDPMTKKWCTVSKVGNGFDDKTLDRLQTELDMVKINKDMSKVPSWLNIKKHVVPDFIVADPLKAPVWEITGAEFSKAEIHTADGISIRFPRLTKMRDDKSWKEATNLPRLRELYKVSKEVSNFPSLVTSKSSTSEESVKEKQMQKEETESNKSESKNGQMSSDKTLKRKQTGENKTEQEAPVTKVQKLNEANNTTSNKCDSLPDVFTNVKVYIPRNIENYEKLTRFVIAFNGEIVPEFQKSLATHIVIVSGINEEDAVSSDSVSCVTPEWLWKCIKKKKQVSEKKYIFSS